MCVSLTILGHKCNNIMYCDACYIWMIHASTYNYVSTGLEHVQLFSYLVVSCAMYVFPFSTLDAWNIR